MSATCPVPWFCSHNLCPCRIVSGFTNNQVVANTTFSGFTGPTAFAFSTCDHCNFPNSKNQGAKTTHFANITYIDTDSFVFYGSRLNAILHDMDGTLSGYPAGWSDSFLATRAVTRYLLLFQCIIAVV